MARTPSFCGVILAAGASSRMGRDKALLPWPPRGHTAATRGYPSVLGEAAAAPLQETFLGTTLATLDPFCDMVMVVCGDNYDALAPIVYARGAFVLRNPSPEAGQFSSLRLGLQEVLNRGRDAAIVTLVDRPPVAPDTVRILMEHFLAGLEGGKWAVVPELEGKHGHPIVVGREMITEFLRAPANSTARDVEHALQQRIQYVSVSDPFVTLNVDTPEDYQKLCNDFENSAATRLDRR